MKLLKKEDLINLIIKAINFPKKKYKNTSSLNSFEDWDSIGHLNIMLLLDQKLSGKAKNIKELADADTVEKIEKILRKKKLLK
jgi:acyl carrier protein